jgi:hypothetical protein
MSVFYPGSQFSDVEKRCGIQQCLFRDPLLQSGVNPPAFHGTIKSIKETMPSIPKCPHQLTTISPLLANDNLGSLARYHNLCTFATNVAVDINLLCWASGGVT